MAANTPIETGATFSEQLYGVVSDPTFQGWVPAKKVKYLDSEVLPAISPEYAGFDREKKSRYLQEVIFPEIGIEPPKPQTNFFGDVANEFGNAASLDIADNPSGGGIGSFIGRTAGSFVPVLGGAAVGSLAGPVGAVAGGIIGAGASGAGRAIDRQMDAGTPFDQLNLGPVAVEGIGDAALQGIGAKLLAPAAGAGMKALAGYAAKNAALSGGGEAIMSPLLQFQESGSIDPQRTLMDIAGAVGSGGALSFLPHNRGRQPSITPEQARLQLVNQAAGKRAKITGRASESPFKAKMTQVRQGFDTAIDNAKRSQAITEQETLRGRINQYQQVFKQIDQATQGKNLPVGVRKNIETLKGRVQKEYNAATQELATKYPNKTQKIAQKQRKMGEIKNMNEVIRAGVRAREKKGLPEKLFNQYLNKNYDQNARMVINERVGKVIKSKKDANRLKKEELTKQRNEGILKKRQIDAQHAATERQAKADATAKAKEQAKAQADKQREQLKAKVEKEKARIKADREAERARIKAEKEAEKARLKAEVQADKDRIKAIKEKEKQAAETAKAKAKAQKEAERLQEKWAKEEEAARQKEAADMAKLKAQTEKAAQAIQNQRIKAAVEKLQTKPTPKADYERRQKVLDEVFEAEKPADKPKKSGRTKITQTTDDMVRTITKNENQTVLLEYEAEIAGESLSSTFRRKEVVPIYVDVNKSGDLYVRAINENGQIHTYYFDHPDGSRILRVVEVEQPPRYYLDDDGTTVRDWEGKKVQQYQEPGIKSSELKRSKGYSAWMNDILEGKRQGKVRDILNHIDEGNIDAVVEDLTPEQRQKLHKDVTGRDC